MEKNHVLIPWVGLFKARTYANGSSARKVYHVILFLDQEDQYAIKQRMHNTNLVLDVLNRN
ncbi:MAG: hypothetical protein OXC92_04595 [Flavobacteriaceae bacterium]|nr:hypothetical protein [Flavobacteriaceae bacterium]MCY4297809.1 hypothetical protein [Flavobacteriaceae bacterium]